MNRYYSYLNTAVAILNDYPGQEPFASFLKRFFSQHKKYGSKDRKMISHLCYSYFRLGKAFPDLQVDNRIILGFFFSSQAPSEMLGTLQPAMNEHAGKSFTEKIKLLNDGTLAIAGMEINPDNFNVFPWVQELGEQIDPIKWNESFFIQPDLFLRLRPGKEKSVAAKLEEASIPYTSKSGSCISLANASSIDKVVALDTEAVIQDINSQRVGELMQLVKAPTSQPLKVWDCCAASGGKSILAYDVLKNIDLTVSDIRESILLNLKKRLQHAGINNYFAFTGDLTHPGFIFPKSRGGRSNTPSFELIICDAPCTGSGTWSRTPEQLYYFDPVAIDKYSTIQKKIASSAVQFLQPNGYFLYITCSVFKKENEEIVTFLEANPRLELVEVKVLPGYEDKADTMFAALFRNTPTEAL